MTLWNLRPEGRRCGIAVLAVVSVINAGAESPTDSLNLKVSGEFRVRYVDRGNAGDINRSRDFLNGPVENDNNFFYLRNTVGLGIKPSNRISTYVAIRDQRAYGDLRDPSPRQDWLDIYRAELKIAISDDTSVTLGRQEISYGSRLVVGTPNYRNGRSFDAVQFRMDAESYKLSAAVGRQVERDRSQLNSSVDQPWIATLFLDSPASGRNGLSWDSILAFKHRDADAGTPIDVGTWGVRIKSPKSHRPWFWSAETAYQFGSVSRGGERLDHTAWAFNGRVGRRFNELDWKPSLSVEYFHSPGDGNPNDDKNETWDLMFFGGGHPRAGRMDLTGWRNIQYLSFSAKAKPHKTLTLGASQTGFWLESDQDGFYGQTGGAPRNGNGYGIRPGAPSDLGWETMIWANWKHASGFSLLIEAGNFSVGDYIEDSLSGSGGARNAQLVSVTGTFRF